MRFLVSDSPIPCDLQDSIRLGFVEWSPGNLLGHSQTDCDLVFTWNVKIVGGNFYSCSGCSVLSQLSLARTWYQIKLRIFVQSSCAQVLFLDLLWGFLPQLVWWLIAELARYSLYRFISLCRVCSSFCQFCSLPRDWWTGVISCACGFMRFCAPNVAGHGDHTIPSVVWLSQFPMPSRFVGATRDHTKWRDDNSTISSLANKGCREWGEDDYTREIDLRFLRYRFEERGEGERSTNERRGTCKKASERSADAQVLMRERDD